MAITTSWNYDNAGTFANVVGGSERVWFTDSPTAVNALDVGAYPDNTVVGNSSGSTVTAEANNCKYISTTEVDLNGGGTVDLITANVAQADCSFRVDWSDSAGNTTLANVKLFAYDGVTPTTAPANVLIVAFERTASAIRKSNDEGAGDGEAWDDSNGIGGLAKALDMADHVSAASHSFYIGVSAKATAFGTHTAIKLRISFDVS